MCQGFIETFSLCERTCWVEETMWTGGEKSHPFDDCVHTSGPIGAEGVEMVWSFGTQIYTSIYINVSVVPVDAYIVQPLYCHGLK